MRQGSIVCICIVQYITRLDNMPGWGDGGMTCAVGNEMPDGINICKMRGVCDVIVCTYIQTSSHN